MRVCILFIIIFILSVGGWSQKTDSLIRLVRPASMDTSQVHLLNKIAFNFMETDPEKGLKYADAALIKSKKINYRSGSSHASNIKGVCYDVLGNYDSSLYYYKQALNIFPVKSNEAFLASVYSNIGLVYWNLDQYTEALENFNKAKHLVEQTSDKRILAAILGNTGLIYHDVKDYPQSNAFFEKAISVHQQQNDTLGSIGPVMNLAINYFETKHYAECEALFRRYTPYINRLDDYSKSEFLVNKATLEINTRLKATTEKDLDESLRLKKQIGHSLGVANVLIQFSELYHQKGDFRKANRYCYEALALSEELKALKKLGQVYDNLFFNYAVLNNNDSAQKYRKLYTALIDTMFAESKAQAFSREQVAFNTFEKEKENLALLNENNQIRLKNQLIIFSAIFLICLLAISFWFYSRIKKQKTFAKQKEITDQLIFEAEQGERERIARDLHDSVGQKLSVVKMKLSVSGSDPVSTGELLDQAIADVRTASHNLMPEDLRKGLINAIEEITENINYTRQDTKAQLSVGEALRKQVFPKQMELYLYRVVQEIVNNALRYAQAKNIHIHMDLEKHCLKLVLSDDGIGLPGETDRTGGIGLKNIRARIEQLKGRIQLVSAPQEGTRFIITVPL